jgi:DNA polymerase III subunit alpha, Gram-positive type
MSLELLKHSVLYDVLFPPQDERANESSESFALRRRMRHVIGPETDLLTYPTVVFDTETTGLDAKLDRIIEFGAIKYVKGKPVDEFWSFVRTDIELTENIRNLTGISQEMIADAPKIEAVLPQFLKFIRGSILVAHNAEFDMSMLHAACNRLGLDLEWPCFCTVKLARKILPGLPNYKLDTLAEHFQLTFEARHRAVGDVKVLGGILNRFYEDDEFGIESWKDVSDCSIES